MNWKMIIEQRRSKEAATIVPYDLKIPCHLYQMAMEHALGRMTPLERRILILRFVEARPIARVADALDMSWNGADALIDEAVEKFRRLIEGSIFEFKQQNREDFYEMAMASF